MWNLFKKNPAEEENLKLNQIQAQLEEAKKDLDSTNAIIKDNLYTLAIQEKTIKANKDTITSQEEILRGYGILEDIGYQFENTPPLSEAEQNLAEAEEQLAAITGSDNIIIYTRTYRIDGSERKGQKFQEAYGKNLLMGFNAYALSKEKGKSNYAYASELIKKSFEKFNKQGELVGIMLNPEFLTARLAVLSAKCQVRQAKAEEAAKMREYKRKLREEAKVLAEITKTKEKLEKERRYYEQTLGETYDEAKRQEIQDKIAEIDKRVQDCDYREKNQKAGFLYVARSDAMPNYVKLGVTRRLAPLVRLQELSSASVPFPFKCYGLVFSDDVFELEAKVHQYFDQKRVNAFNRHKEFFNITPAEAVYVLTNKFKCKVTFVDETHDDQEEMINMAEYTKRVVSNADSCCDGNKIKTHFVQIIVQGKAEKPYYEILYFDTEDRTYHIGFGSYCLDYVFEWLSNEFEIVEAEQEADVAPVRHGRWEIVVGSDGKEHMICTGCRKQQDLTGVFSYCPNCGAKMDLEG